MRRAYLDGPWGQVHLRRAGAGPPQVVLLHESPLSGRVFEEVLELLAPEIAAVALDTPGYGGSAPPPGPVEIPAYARALLAALAKLGAERVTLAGVHTGAALAASIAAQAPPGRVGSLVLSGAPIWPPAERRRWIDGWAPPVELTADGNHLGWAWDRYRRIYGAGAPAAMVHRAAAELLAVLPRYDWAYGAALRYDPVPDLRAAALPTLLLSAEGDLLADCDDRALELGLATRLQIFPGLPGQLSQRCPAEYAEALREWLAALS